MEQRGDGPAAYDGPVTWTMVIGSRSRNKAYWYAWSAFRRLGLDGEPTLEPQAEGIWTVEVLGDPPTGEPVLYKPCCMVLLDDEPITIRTRESALSPRTAPDASSYGSGTRRRYQFALRTRPV